MDGNNDTSPSSNVAELPESVEEQNPIPEISVENCNIEPSFQNLTRDYLLKNYRKIDLQKFCRELGYTRIWETKEKLIDMILEKKKKSIEKSGEDVQDRDNEEVNVPVSNLLLQQIMRDVDELKERLNAKDLQNSEINEKLSHAQNTIQSQNHTIQNLQERLSALENQVLQNRARNDEHGTSSNTQSISPQEKLLFLGDSNICKMASSDLSEKCSIRTLNGANLDIIKCWVAEKLTWTPTKCILYCGMQDLQDDASSETIIDNLGELISTLKEKNENMTIYVCELVPALKDPVNQCQVKDYNNVLIEWCFKNNLNIIKTDLPFRLGTGELDELCLHASDNSNFLTLNRFGVVRLLDIICKQYPDIGLCDDLHEVKRNLAVLSGKIHYASHKVLSSNENGFNSGKNKNMENGNDRNINRNNHNHLNISNRRPQFPNSNARNTTNPRYNSPISPMHNRAPQYPPPRTHPYPQTDAGNYNATQNSDRYNSRSYRSKGCLNCGEYNHNQTTCRFDHQLRCRNCNMLGHKSKLCFNQTQ